MPHGSTEMPWLEQIMAASPETLGLVMLEADPHGWRLDRSERLAAVADALGDGAAAAGNLRAQFPGLTPREIAHALGLPIHSTDDDPLVGSLWRFAEYQPRPSRILLYSRGLAPLDRMLVDPLAARLLGPATLQDAFIAHELFHHMEATRSTPPIARRYRPTLFRVGGWHWRTGIAALSEIAAGAFAQSLLGLPCYPRVLDLVARDTVASSAAASRSRDAM
ncbi:hypothetical protein [Bradyrhizobium sp.]|uniref:hypothetical protein n=1 Tax=Bradyrhizobium sp. TaxID=376 RepID=UPI003C73644C